MYANFPIIILIPNLVLIIFYGYFVYVWFTPIAYYTTYQYMVLGLFYIILIPDKVLIILPMFDL